jgi:flagellar hook assembly protein FlgD
VLGLYSNAPNPSKYHTKIAFSLREMADVDLSVYDVNGSRVVTLKSGATDDGVYTVDWDLRDNKGHRVPAGNYVYRLAVNGGFTRSGRMVVLR